MVLLAPRTRDIAPATAVAVRMIGSMANCITLNAAPSPRITPSTEPRPSRLPRASATAATTTLIAFMAASRVPPNAVDMASANGAILCITSRRLENAASKTSMEIALILCRASATVLRPPLAADLVMESEKFFADAARRSRALSPFAPKASKIVRNALPVFASVLPRSRNPWIPSLIQALSSPVRRASAMKSPNFFPAKPMPPVSSANTSKPTTAISRNAADTGQIALVIL